MPSVLYLEATVTNDPTSGTLARQLYSTLGQEVLGVPNKLFADHRVYLSEDHVYPRLIPALRTLRHSRVPRRRGDGPRESCFSEFSGRQHDCRR